MFVPFHLGLLYFKLQTDISQNINHQLRFILQACKGHVSGVLVALRPQNGPLTHRPTTSISPTVFQLGSGRTRQLDSTRRSLF